jgi:hypothetical protein
MNKAQRILWSLILLGTGIICTLACGMTVLMCSMSTGEFINLCMGW